MWTIKRLSDGWVWSDLGWGPSHGKAYATTKDLPRELEGHYLQFSNWFPLPAGGYWSGDITDGGDPLFALVFEKVMEPDTQEIEEVKRFLDSVMDAAVKDLESFRKRLEVPPYEAFAAFAYGGDSLDAAALMEAVKPLQEAVNAGALSLPEIVEWSENRIQDFILPTSSSLLKNTAEHYLHNAFLKVHRVLRRYR